MQSFSRELAKRPNSRLVGLIDGGATGLIHDPAVGYLLCFVHESQNRFARWTSETMRIDDTRASRLIAEYRMQESDPFVFKPPQ